MKESKWKNESQSAQKLDLRENNIEEKWTNACSKDHGQTSLVAVKSFVENDLGTVRQIIGAVW